MYELTIIAYLTLFAWLGWRRFDTALFILFAALPVYLIRFDLVGIPLTLLEGMIAVIVIAALVTKKIDWRRLREPYLVIPALMFLISATVGVLVSPNTIGALGVWKAYFVEPILLAVVLLGYATREHVRSIATALGVSVIIVALYGFWQWTNGIAVPPAFLTAEGSVDRIVSFYGYPNAVGLFIGPIVALYSALLFEKQSWQQRLWRLTVIILGAAAIILAKSEAAIGALVGIWLVLALIYTRTRIAAIIAGIAGTVAIILYQPLLQFILSKVLLQDYSGFIRRLIWQESWQMLLDRPILGAGLAGYQTTIAQYHLPTFEIFLYPHNIVLNFWSEIGIVGMLLALYLIGYQLVTALRGARGDRDYFWWYIGAGAIMGHIIIQGLVDAPYFKNDLSVLFWLVVILPVIIYRNRVITRSEATGQSRS